MKRNLTLIVIYIFVLAATIGGTLAYIVTKSPSLTNAFVPAHMSCEVIEDFSNGVEKKNVCVKNTSDSSTYIRVKLLPYWYDKENDSIVARDSWTLSFSSGENWILGKDGYYYYICPVASGECTSILIPTITLKQDEVSLSRQVLEIMASCIQAEPANAVSEAWSGTNGSVIQVKDGILIIESLGEGE